MQQKQHWAVIERNWVLVLPLTSSWSLTLPFCHLSQCLKMFTEASVCCVLCRIPGGQNKVAAFLELMMVEKINSRSKIRNLK